MCADALFCVFLQSLVDDPCPLAQTYCKPCLCAKHKEMRDRKRLRGIQEHLQQAAGSASGPATTDGYGEDAYAGARMLLATQQSPHPQPGFGQILHLWILLPDAWCCLDARSGLT